MAVFPLYYLPGPNYGQGNEDNGNLLQKVPCMDCYTQWPQPCSRPLLMHATARDFWTLTDQSGSVFCGVTAPFSWVLVHIRFCLCPPRVCFPVLCKFWWLFGGVNGDLLQVGLCHSQLFCSQSPCPCGNPLLTHTSTGDTQTQFCLSLRGGLCVLVCTRFVWALWASLADMGFDSKHDFTPPTILLGLIFCSWMWGISSQSLIYCSATTPVPSILLGLLCPWTWGISSQLLPCQAPKLYLQWTSLDMT